MTESPPPAKPPRWSFAGIAWRLRNAARRWRNRPGRIAGEIAEEVARRERSLLANDLQRVERGLDSRLHALREQLERQAESITCLAEASIAAAGAAPAPTPGPLVSIIMPVRNLPEPEGAAVLDRAIESIAAQSYPHWELLIVDDGSDDQAPEHLRAWAEREPRIRLLAQPPQGQVKARNAAMRQARGELFAYLDCDNSWYPHFLAMMVRELLAHPEAPAAYTGQLVHRSDQPGAYARGEPFDWERFRRRGGIDMNCYVHRRELFEQHGGFDESLTRLVDWDLVGRYALQAGPPRWAPGIGGRYHEARPGSVSAREYFGPNAYRVRRRLEPLRGEGLRVLYLAGDYPNLSETYIRWEIAAMRRWGVEVEVWSEAERPGSPFTSEVPVHHGDPREVIARFQPHVLHFHWMHVAEKQLAAVEESGLPMTVRAHSFEFGPERLQRLADHPRQRGVFAFPHLVARHPSPNIVPMPVGLYGELYYPKPEFDPRLVARVGSALPSKDLTRFIDAARLCPEHRFVAYVSVSTGLPRYAEELIAYNERMGSPVEIRTRVPTEEVAALLRRAGVYVHTHGEAGYFGMPISIVESMACGGYVLARRLPGAAEFVGPAGRLYETTEQLAAAIHETTNWSAERWSQVRRTAIEWAYGRHADLDIYRPLVETWQAARRETAAGRERRPRRAA